MKRSPRSQNDDGTRWIVRASGRDDVVARSRKQAEAIHARLMAAGRDAVLTVAHVVPQPYQAGNRLERRLPETGVHRRVFDGPTEGLIRDRLEAERCHCDRCVDLRCLPLSVRRFGDEDHLDGVVVGRDDKVRQKVMVK